MTTSIYTRMFQVQDKFGVSEDQVRIWDRKGLIKIHKRGRMSFVRDDDMQKLIEGAAA